MGIEYVRPTKRLEATVAINAELNALPIGDSKVQELSRSLINSSLVFDHLKAMLDTAIAMRLQYDDLNQKDKNYFTLKDQQTLTRLLAILDKFIIDTKPFLE